MNKRAAALFLALGIAGCNLDVRLPTRVPASALDDPALAANGVQGAVADFECALANYVSATALLTDELYASSNFAQLNNWDRRIQYESGGPTGCVPNSEAFGVGVYEPLSRARFQADDWFRRIAGFDDTQLPGRTTLLATAAAYAGYSYTLFGEGFCEAAFDLGSALTWREVLDTAEERFTRAINLAESAGVDSTLNMARVGRARVRLDLGKNVEAAADARLVPVGFVKYATYSSVNARRENRVYEANQKASVDPRFRNLTVDGVPDSRVRLIDAGRPGQDGSTPQWYQTKYTSSSSPIVVASWDEAQLIMAEAEGGQSAVDAINRLRAQAGLPPFASTDADGIANQVRIERTRELFMEGQRLNDMLRFGIPFDAGVNHRGLTMGTMTCLQLPQVERDNNPNLVGRPRKTTR